MVESENCLPRDSRLGVEAEDDGMVHLYGTDWESGAHTDHHSLTPDNARKLAGMLIDAAGKIDGVGD